jgi:hypothetical protein
LEFVRLYIKQYLPNTPPEKPKNLKKMIEIAKILYDGFTFVRVDLYDTGNNIWFGELTFGVELCMGIQMKPLK